MHSSTCCISKIHSTAKTVVTAFGIKLTVQKKKGAAFLYKLLVKKTDCAILPRPVFTVVGLNAFHTIVSQILVAMKREMPEPRPYPFWSSSSKSRTIKPATKSYSKKRNTALVPCHFHVVKKNNVY